MKEVYLARKGTCVVHHTNMASLLKEGLVAEKTVSEAEFEAAGGLLRIIDGQIVLGKTESEKAAEKERAALTTEMARLKAELAEKDYEVVKAAENGKVLSAIDPELHKRREDCRARINEIEGRLSLQPQL